MMVIVMLTVVPLYADDPPTATIAAVLPVVMLPPLSSASRVTSGAGTPENVAALRNRTTAVGSSINAALCDSGVDMFTQLPPPSPEYCHTP